MWRFWWIPLGRIEAPLARLHAEDQRNVIIRDWLFDQDRSQKCRKSLLTWFGYRTLRDRSQSSGIRWSLVSFWCPGEVQSQQGPEAGRFFRPAEPAAAGTRSERQQAAEQRTTHAVTQAVKHVTCLYSDVCVCLQVHYKKKYEQTKAQYHLVVDTAEQLHHKENAVLHSQVPIYVIWRLLSLFKAVTTLRTPSKITTVCVGEGEVQRRVWAEQRKLSDGVWRHWSLSGF